MALNRIETARLFHRAEDMVPQRATINAGSAGPNTVVAAVTGKKIIVLEYVLVASGAVTVTWESQDGTVLGGPMAFAANGGAAPPFSPVGKLATKAGQALVLFLSDAVQVGGHLVYITTAYSG